MDKKNQQDYIYSLNTNNAFKSDEYEILILYGSQTGTAKFAAEELERELFKNKFSAKVSEMDAYNLLNLPEEQFIILIISTTGYGEFPTNAKSFWNFLMRKDLPGDSLEQVSYSLFGLGDSAYEKFNQCAKLLNSRLAKLSANLFHPVALGDDQHDFGYEAEFDPWVQSIIEELFNYFPHKRIKDSAIVDKFDYFQYFINSEINFDVEVLHMENIEYKCYCNNNNFNITNEDDCANNIFENLLENYKQDGIVNSDISSYINTAQQDKKDINRLLPFLVQSEKEKKLFEKIYGYYANFLNDKDIKYCIARNKIGLITNKSVITRDDAVKKVFNLTLAAEPIEDHLAKKYTQSTSNETNYNSQAKTTPITSEKIKFMNKLNTEFFLNFENEKIKSFSREITPKSLLSYNSQQQSCQSKLHNSLAPGDSVLLFPENDEESVNKFMKFYGLKENDYLIFHYRSSTKSLNISNIRFPFIIQARDFISKWLNINASPNRFFCFIARNYAQEGIYVEKLELFASKTSVNICFTRFIFLIKKNNKIK